jgi:signal transduction histidine kinase/DNA-binding NarL/FixJ family response regulator
MEIKATILIVDDEPANLNLLADLLSSAGFGIVAAAKGQDALRRAREAQPDLILLDIMMPDIDGYAVCRELMSDRDTQTIPIIFISARDETPDLVKGFQAGGVDYITKPFQQEELLARVNTHLALRRSQQQIEDQRARLQHEIAERERVEKASRQARDELVTLLAYSRSITSTLELEPLLELTLILMEQIIDYDRAVLLLLEGDVLIGKAIHGSPTAVAVSSLRIPVQAAPAIEKLIRERQGFCVDDVQAEVARSQADNGEESLNLAAIVAGGRSWMVAPLVIKNKVIGMLSLVHREPGFYQPHNLDLLQVFVNQLAMAIEITSLYEQAQEAAVLGERSRLAAELHDSVTQTLFSANLVADVLPQIWQQNPAAGSAKLSELRRLTKGALAEMRGLLIELRPEALRHAKLHILLQQLARVLEGQVQATVIVNVDEAPELPAEVQNVFYRIAQETLNNFVKHARATELEVSLQVSPPVVSGQADSWQGLLLMQIADNGHGFRQNQIPSDRLGLTIMAERAASIGAELDISSEPGQGTAVDLFWQTARENYD